MMYKSKPDLTQLIRDRIKHEHQNAPLSITKSCKSVKGINFRPKNLDDYPFLFKKNFV